MAVGRHAGGPQIGDDGLHRSMPGSAGDCSPVMMPCKRSGRDCTAHRPPTAPRGVPARSTARTSRPWPSPRVVAIATTAPGAPDPPVDYVTAWPRFDLLRPVGADAAHRADPQSHGHIADGLRARLQRGRCERGVEVRRCAPRRRGGGRPGPASAGSRSPSAGRSAARRRTPPARGT